jgi:hypothetical protein
LRSLWERSGKGKGTLCHMHTTPGSAIRLTH